MLYVDECCGIKGKKQKSHFSASAVVQKKIKISLSVGLFIINTHPFKNGQVGASIEPGSSHTCIPHHGAGVRQKRHHLPTVVSRSWIRIAISSGG